MADSPRIYPNNANQYDRQLWDMVYDLRDQMGQVAPSIATVQKSIPDPAQIQRDLQSSGSKPLNVTALTGRLMTNQYAFVPQFSPSPPPLYDPVSQVGDGALSTVRSAGNTGGAGILYRFNEPIDLGNWQAQQAVGANLIGTHAERLANYPASSWEPGTVFFETDRTVFYIVKAVASVNAWYYVAGQMVSSSSTLVDLPGDLGANDVGFLYGSTFWAHEWIFLNSGPTGYFYAPGDPGSGYFVAAPAAPHGGKWGICDGSTYTFPNENTQGAAVITPDLTTGAFIRGGPFSQPINLATRATWEATAVTDDEALHSHVTEVPPITIDNGTGTPLDVGSTGFFPTVSTTPHHHVLSNSLAQLKLFSDANGGLPANVKLDWYLRL